MYIYGNHDQETLKQFNQIFEFPWVTDGALMADAHLGYSFPIGGVAASATHVSPSGVGYDIGCGNNIVKLDVKITPEIFEMIQEIMESIHRVAGFGLGSKSKQDHSGHPIFQSDDWATELLMSLRNNAIDQLGTAGTSNHYIDIFIDNDMYLWVGTHFGSRNLGHKIATHFIEVAGATTKDPDVPVWLNVNTPEGREYLHAMRLAGNYAFAGRDVAIHRSVDIIREFLGDVRIIDLVYNHHNYAWFDEGFWVMRKGATPVGFGKRSFIGGSMGTESAIITVPFGSKDFFTSMGSSPHGAGRMKSRNDAAGKKKRVGGRWVRVTPGSISQQEMDEWLTEYGVVLVGGGREEAPQAYRNLMQDVLPWYDYDIVKVLRPIGVAMHEDTIPSLEDMDE